MNTTTELLAGPSMKQVWKHITRIKHFYKLFACRLSPIFLFLFNKGVYLAFTDIQTIAV
jgi:hypothetical protein